MYGHVSAVQVLIGANANINLPDQVSTHPHCFYLLQLLLFTVQHLSYLSYVILLLSLWYLLCRMATQHSTGLLQLAMWILFNCCCRNMLISALVMRYWFCNIYIPFLQRTEVGTRILISITTQNGFSPLHMASLFGHAAVVDALLNNGAHPNLAIMVWRILCSVHISSLYFMSEHCPDKIACATCMNYLLMVISVESVVLVWLQVLMRNTSYSPFAYFLCRTLVLWEQLLKRDTLRQWRGF